MGSGGCAGNTGQSGTSLTGGRGGVPVRLRSGYRSELAPIGLIGVLVGVLGPAKAQQRPCAALERGGGMSCEGRICYKISGRSVALSELKLPASFELRNCFIPA